MLPGCLKHLLTPRGFQKFPGVHSFPNISEANAKESLGKRTRVQGWVRALRKMKDNIFLDINDGSTNQHLQIVMKKDLKPDNLCYGSSISIIGEVASAPNGRAEVRAEEVEVLGTCDLDSYPFLPRKQYSQEYIRQYLHLRPRTRQFSSVLRLRDLATSAVGEHMRSRGFVNVHTPILTSNDCEGAGEVFNVVPDSVELIDSMKKEGKNREETYFDAKTFLTVSGQLHLEITARALSRVYTFGPTFRAENSKSRLHLSEFYMIEAEMAFVDNVEDVAAEAELLVKGVTSTLFERGAADAQNLGAAPPAWLDKSFGVFTYGEAFDILDRHSDKLAVDVKRGEALSKEQELFLVEFNGGIPVFILNWPKNIKPFYMKECKDDDTKVAAMDLLAPQVGELFGGSLREDNYEKLQEKIPPTGDVSWYLDLRKYGNVPTGGFGMGFERYLQAVLGIANIKDVIPFPRWPHNCSL
ncbi:probable asparagine--tRNA ligase, mitochondrial [Diachasma alloeum]|uniref:probable asparagine--tRNA ligase, mitochondrial n=1 Tax=Diachasma alloeum TaxID=454923 RepID=UPI0007383CDA|nr:probable asparagine--tRNA ligase, mitochondrial [Diachasma alloeum]